MSDLRASGRGPSPSSGPSNGDMNSIAAAPAADSGINQGERPGAGQHDVADTESSADAAPAGQQPTVAEGITEAVAAHGSSTAQWLLFNDFAISPADSGDVLRLYGAHKVPVLLYYRQVCATTRTAEQLLHPISDISCQPYVGPPVGCRIVPCFDITFPLHPPDLSLVHGTRSLTPCTCSRAGQVRPDGARTGAGCPAAGAHRGALLRAMP